jgi:hypothetical protein
MDKICPYDFVGKPLKKLEKAAVSQVKNQLFS